MSNYLVTGANRGIGLEFVRQLVARDGAHVVATCRDPEGAEDLQALSSAHQGQITILALDVADAQSVASLVEALKARDLKLDMVINNAGIYPKAGGLGELDYDRVMRGFEVNTVGPLRLAEAMLPHLTGEKKVINLTSQMGSIEDNTSGGSYAYRMSKAALNMGFKSFAIDTEPRGVISLVMHPGWVQTDMGGPNALITTEQSVSGMLDAASRATQSDSGKFLGWKGNEIPW